jgi:hypothetical protein
MLTKFRDSSVAKRAAELIVPMLSSASSPRSVRSAGGGERCGAGSPHPMALASPFNSAAAAAASDSSSSIASGSSGGGLRDASSSVCATPDSIASVIHQAAVAAAAAAAQEQQGGPQQQREQQEQQQRQQQQQKQQQQHQHHRYHQQQQRAQTPAIAGAYSSFTAAKKTIGKLFGSGGSGSGGEAAAAWSNGGSSGRGALGSPQGSGLIAAFRAIIPKASGSSAPGAAAGGAGEPGGRTTVLAVCPHLPPSMQRAEWRTDDFIITDKLYTGYASVGEGAALLPGSAAARTAPLDCPQSRPPWALRQPASGPRFAGQLPCLKPLAPRPGAPRFPPPPPVYKAICKRSREVVVLKSYTLSAICELYQHQIFREVRLHSSLQHENIVKLYAAFKVRSACVPRSAGCPLNCLACPSPPPNTAAL